jgi:hypothetical protein
LLGSAKVLDKVMECCHICHIGDMGKWSATEGIKRIEGNTVGNQPADAVRPTVSARNVSRGRTFPLAPIGLRGHWKPTKAVNGTEVHRTSNRTNLVVVLLIENGNKDDLRPVTNTPNAIIE